MSSTTEPESTAVRSRKSLPYSVKVLGVASLLNDIASEMIYPLLPSFLASLRASNTLLGAIEGSAETISSLLKLYFGRASDRWQRRKPLVVIGYLIAAVSRPTIGLTTAGWQVLVARSFDRVGKGIRTAPRDAMVADSTAPDQRGRAFGFHRAMDHLGAAIGPLVAFGFLALWPGQLRSLFLISIIPGLAVVALVQFGIREKSLHQTAPPAAAAPRLALRLLSGRFRVFLCASLIFALGNSSDAFLLVRAQEVGIAVGHLPLLWCLFHVVKSTGSYLAGGIVDRIGSWPMMIGGWTIYALLYIAFALASAPWQVWIMMSLYALSHAVTEPAERTMVANLVPAHQKGSAFGWFHFTVGIAALPANLVFGAIYERLGALWAFVWGAALALIAVAILCLMSTRRGEDENLA